MAAAERRRPAGPSALSEEERQLATDAGLPVPRTGRHPRRSPLHLDPAAEEHAEAAFARRPGTLIVIAHRITSAMRARRVLVLDGSSAQVGDHASLVGSSAVYRDLVGYWSAAPDPGPGPGAPKLAPA
ncbi:MAG: ABC transporter ATP-binding protein [Streptosporangiaceae bacterium]|nr:ABC transporter ATP-binding protein [Streptosporangiaceae bacterium]MBV9856922.1 ABC transporter ATP-binding protein [Streptosporangiaceae bacterium]